MIFSKPSKILNKNFTAGVRNLKKIRMVFQYENLLFVKRLCICIFLFVQVSIWIFYFPVEMSLLLCVSRK